MTNPISPIQIPKYEEPQPKKSLQEEQKTQSPHKKTDSVAVQTLSNVKPRIKQNTWSNYYFTPITARVSKTRVVSCENVCGHFEECYEALKKGTCIMLHDCAGGKGILSLLIQHYQQKQQTAKIDEAIELCFKTDSVTTLEVSKYMEQCKIFQDSEKVEDKAYVQHLKKCLSNFFRGPLRQ